VKNDPAIFALALCASAPEAATRVYALAALPKVCRIPTHLFHFCTYVKQFRGLGRGLRRALAAWYNDMPVDKLAYEVVKYQQRDGWANRDVLRLAHPKTKDPARNAVYKWIVDGWQVDWTPDTLPPIVGAFERVKNVEDVVREIREFNLSREMLPTKALTHPEVWEALLEKMPYTAMIRNLGNMSKVGLTVPMSAASRLVAERLHDREALKRGRIHPVTLLIALKTYASGQGIRGSGTWTVDPRIADALDDAFYLAFDALEPTGKRFLFGVDVSGSMGMQMASLPISCAEGAAAMALACAKTETEYFIMGFAATFRDLGITAKMRLDDVLKRTLQRNFGSTDCAQPMLWADKQKVGVDCFVVITDNETWHGPVHASQALTAYRQRMGIDAKEIVIAMTPTPFTIADPTDPLTLDICGFDSAVPQIVTDFAGRD
jgi:60 kDa SS-A/Ro ribonucleoprotein